MNDLELTIIDKKLSTKYTGWKEVSVSLSLNRLAGLFEISAVEELSKQGEGWNLRMGQSCVVKIKGQTVITGYIDYIDESYDEKSHRILIKGRDKTCDLVDCSYVPEDYTKIETHEWNNQTALTVITALCEPFNNITVNSDASVKEAATELLAKFKVSVGETAGDAIKRICNAKGIMPMSKGDGNLYLTRAGTKSCYGTIIRGKNVKKGRLLQTDRERFSHYFVRGKGVSKRVNLFSQEINPIALVQDEVVMQQVYGANRKTTEIRYRPKVLTTDIISNFTIDTSLKTTAQTGTTTQKVIAEVNICKTRGEQEARIRAGKSRALYYTLYSWFQNPKRADFQAEKIWPVNNLVNVYDPTLKVEGTYLITDVRFNFSEGDGSTTDLILMKKDAYMILRKPIRKIVTSSDQLFSSEALREMGFTTETFLNK